MDVLLFALGLFGVLPIVTMSFFYGVIPLVLIGLQVLGAIEHFKQASAAPPAVSSPPDELDRAA